MPAFPILHPASWTRPHRLFGRSFFGKILNALARRHQASDLERLDDRLLKDIGLSRAEAELEIRRLRQF